MISLSKEKYHFLPLASHSGKPEEEESGAQIIQNIKVMRPKLMFQLQLFLYNTPTEPEKNCAFAHQ